MIDRYSILGCLTVAAILAWPAVFYGLLWEMHYRSHPGMNPVACGVNCRGDVRYEWEKL